MKKYYVLSAILVVLGIISFVLFKDENLDPESAEVTTLYGYLGEVDIYHCGGLTTYMSDTVTTKDLNKENMLCMAYYNLDNTDIETKTMESTEKNDNDLNICRVGDKVSLAADDERKCSYETLKKQDLEDAYNMIYGASYSDLEEFYITDTKACYLEGDNYYCGEAETFTYSLANQATIYRAIKKAVKKNNGDIVIYDYFLRVSDNMCYRTNDSEEEGRDCEKAISNLKDKEIDVNFIINHGNSYKHTFKTNDDKNYYWVKSELN